jgi:hypothetical protein
MALDPESRRMYYDLHGGEAGAKNREGQWLLRGQQLTETGEQTQRFQDRQNISRWGARVPNPVKGMGGLPLPGEDPVLKAAMKSLGALGAAADGVTSALGRLENKLNSMTGGGGKPASALPPAPKLGVSAGHALGSRSSASGGSDGVFWHAVDNFIPNWVVGANDFLHPQAFDGMKW